MKDKYNNFIIGLDDQDEAEVLFKQISKSFPSITREIFKAICESILEIDKSINGRFGGGVKDLIAVASSRYESTKKFMNSPLDNLAHVEIGTLFGGTALLTDFILKEINASDKFKNIMIDPLCGYYDNPIDFISGLEVTADGLINNLKKFKVENYELIQKYSTEQEAILRIKDFNVASFFIDGDHSFAGLLKDWNNYNESVVEGGYIIIDNVNDKNWPNINIFIEFLKSKIGTNWEVIYENNITIVLEKKCINNLQIDTTFDVEIIHKIERQIDEKFYRMITYRNNQINQLEERIETRDKELEKAKERIETRDKELEKAKERIETRDKKFEKQNTQLRTIQKASSEVLKIKTLSNPSGKYKAYKNLLKVINETKS